MEQIKTEEELLNKRDLVLAAYALEQMRNLYQQTCDAGEFEEIDEEATREALQHFTNTHAKFNAILVSMDSEPEGEDEA